MPPQTIHAKVRSRILGLAGPGPIRTCTKLIAIDRRDAAGEFRAEFPASDTLLELVTLKHTYLEFEVGGKFFFLGLVERIWTETSDKGQQTTVITGRDQLGALAENTVGDLELVYAFDAPEQIISAADVPNQNFSLSAEGYLVTGYPFTKQFAGESALSALTKVAADIGEHFRAPKAALLEVVWMSTVTADAPVRLVTAGGPRLHENPDVAIISHIERDENGEQLANRIYPFGAGVGAARLTLEHATTSMPSGYSMDTAENYIQNDNQQSLPSVRKSIQKTWNHIGVDIGQTYAIQVATTALTGATTIIVESIALPMASGVLLDLNGGGVDFVELSANVSVGANVLNVVATTFDVLDTDTLVYTNPQAETGAANQLAYAALTHLQRVSDPTRMVAYDLTVRGLPDSVVVGMKIPVLSQAPGFAIDDDLIILQIKRTVTRNGQMPAVVTVVPADWFDLGEASSIAATMEEFRVSQAQDQPVAFASVEGVPAYVETVNGIAGPDPVLDPDDLDDSATTNKFATAASVGASIHGATEKVTIHDDDEFGGINTEASNVLTWWKWSTIKSVLRTAFDAVYVGLTGDQSIAGTKTFTGNVVMAGSTLQVDGLTLFTLGARSFVRAIADDSVLTVAVNAHGWVFINGNNNAGDYAMVQYRSVATLYCIGVALGANVNVTTGVLTGTSGTDGKITISVDSNTLYIENRKGSTRTIAGFFLAT